MDTLEQSKLTYDLEDPEAYFALEDPQEYLAEASTKLIDQNELQLSKFQEFLAVETAVDELPDLEAFCMNYFRDRNTAEITTTLEFINKFTIYRGNKIGLHVSVETIKERLINAYDKYGAKEYKDVKISLSHEQLENRLRLARMEGAQAMQKAILIAFSSGFGIENITATLSHRLDEENEFSSTSRPLVKRLLTRMYKHLGEAIFIVLKGLFLDLNNGNLDSVKYQLDKARMRNIDTSCPSFVSTSESTRFDNAIQAELANPDDNGDENCNLEVVDACDTIVNQLRNYPSAPQPTKQELMLVQFRNSPDHTVSLESLSDIFDDASDPDRQVQRRIPDLNRRLESYGLRIERPSVYQMVPISPHPQT